MALSTSVFAKNRGDQRVEIPVHFDGDRPTIYVDVGSSKQVKLGIDTGAGGIRIWQNNLKASDYERTRIENNVMYGNSVSGLTGELVLAKVKVGNFVIPGKTKIQLVTGHICKDGAKSSCAEDGSRHGYDGTLGLRTFHFDETKKEDTVFNPLIQSGPFPYILSVPVAKGEQGKLIINPTGAEKSRFLSLPLTARNGQHVPVCIHAHCFETIIDTGNGSNAIPVANKKELKALDLPVADEKVVEGTKVPIQFGRGKHSVTFNAVAGKKGATTYKVKDVGNGTLGINAYHYLDVLYDFEKGTIGVALKQ